MQQQTASYAIKEAALIFESNANKILDYVIGVKAPHQLRIQRSLARDKSSIDEVNARMNQQMNEEEKMALCDFLIINDEKSLLIPQVLSLHQQLLKLKKM